MRNFTFFLFIVIFFCACSPYNTQITGEYDRQHYTKVYKTLQKATDSDSNDWLLWKMQLGFLTFSYFGPHFSLDDLELAEQKFKIYESEGILSGISQNVGATFSNDMVIPYRGMIFEGAFLNFYKALAFSSIGNNAQARIEFNRANDRQRRAKDYYAKEIQRSHDKVIEEANKKNKNDIYENSTTDSEINKIIQSKYTTIKNFAVYKDIINPIIPYVSGVFFMIEKDFSKSMDLLKESYGISNADIIASDMQLLEIRKKSKTIQPFTWIIIEDGDMARKDGFDVSIPFSIGDGFNAINIALPYIKEGKQTYDLYRVNNMKADIVSNVSGLFVSEFDKQLPSIIARAIIGAILKYSITHSINQFGGDYGSIIGLATTLAFSATTNSDKRTSIFLPNNIWATRIPNTDSKVSIFGNNIALLNIPITNDCNILDKRLASYKEFYNIIKAKPKDLSARINIFKLYYESGNEDRICAKTDNIVYVRVHRGTVVHTIIKGD